MRSSIQSSKSQTINNKDYSLVNLPSTDATTSDNSILPTDLSNLKAWWDVNSIPDVLDGTTITVLPDLSGNGFHLNSQTGTTVIKRGVAQGKDALRLTGSQRFSCANVLNSKTEFTMFVVWKPNSTVVNILFEQGVSHLSLERTGNLDALFYVGQVGGAAGGSTGVQGVLQYNTLMASSGGLRNFKNGIAGARVTHTGNTGTDTFNLGARSSNSFFTTADVSEIIIYDRALSTEERILVEQYLHVKYAFSSYALSTDAAASLSRVAADGGVANEDYFSEIYRMISDAGILTNAKFWVSPMLARKISDHSISKLYNMFDNSGGTDPVQATVIQQALLSAKDGTSLRGMNMDGVDDTLVAGQANMRTQCGADDFTYFVVARPMAQKGVTTSLGGIDSSTKNYINYPDQMGSNRGFGVSLGTTGINVMGHGSGYAPVLAYYSGAISNTIVLCVVVTSRTPTIYINGTLSTGGSTAADTFYYPSANLGGGVYGYFTGVSYDHIYFNKALSTTERNAVETFLRTKYGV